MHSKLTRRDLLKLCGAAAISLGFRDFPAGHDLASERPPSFKLGRVIYSSRYYNQPTSQADELGYYIRDAVVEVKGQAIGEAKPKQSPVWLRTKDGWLPGAYVQPVQENLNQPVMEIPEGGMLVEVTMPFVQVYSSTDRGLKPVYRYYYASTYWVHYAFQSPQTGRAWYRIWDERNKQDYLAQADYMRQVTADEVTPISPEITDKHIEINLAMQQLTAYEGSRIAFTTRTATGYFEGDTPKGEFRVERKQPSRHMAVNAEKNSFDLPGVPWVCYISWTGVSFHGTYWHNNYGNPQSHGCINLTPNAAKWIYRWTEPSVPINDDYVESGSGTPVVVY